MEEFWSELCTSTWVSIPPRLAAVMLKALGAFQALYLHSFMPTSQHRLPACSVTVGYLCSPASTTGPLSLSFLPPSSALPVLPSPRFPQTISQLPPTFARAQTSCDLQLLPRTGQQSPSGAGGRNRLRLLQVERSKRRQPCKHSWKHLLLEARAPKISNITQHIGLSRNNLLETENKLHN